MRTIKINRYRLTKKALAAAEETLRRGGVVAFPTETAYGLAVDPTHPGAVERIMAIKYRPPDKRLPLVAADADQVRRFFVLPKELAKFTEKYWPGPLTVVLANQTRNRLVDWPDAAVRVPAAVWARALPRALGRPVTATSANLSGQPPCYSGTAVRQAFRGQEQKPDLLLDAGRLPKRPPSTIIRPVNGRLRTLRAGPVVDRMFE